MTHLRGKPGSNLPKSKLAHVGQNVSAAMQNWCSPQSRHIRIFQEYLCSLKLLEASAISSEFANLDRFYVVTAKAIDCFANTHIRKTTANNHSIDEHEVESKATVVHPTAHVHVRPVQGRPDDSCPLWRSPIAERLYFALSQ